MDKWAITMILRIMEVIVMISKIEYKMINSPNNLKSLKAFYTDFANQLDNYSSLPSSVSRFWGHCV